MRRLENWRNRKTLCDSGVVAHFGNSTLLVTIKKAFSKEGFSGEPVVAILELFQQRIASFTLNHSPENRQRVFDFHHLPISENSWFDVGYKRLPNVASLELDSKYRSQL